MKKDNDLMGCIGIAAIATIGIAVGIVANGWALSTLWGWFIVPVFNLPILTIGQAVGISCVTSFLFPKQSKQATGEKKTTTEGIVEIIGIAVIAPVFAVFFGWIILQFVN